MGLNISGKKPKNLAMFMSENQNIINIYLAIVIGFKPYGFRRDNLVDSTFSP
jgi:hypothetical protein